MLLKSLLKNVEYTHIINEKEIEITGIAYDSRKVLPGNLFVCIKGYQSDGHQYINNAIENGAVAIVVEDKYLDYNLPIIKVDNSRKALSFISSNFYNNPSKKLKIIGITGTNGKTSTTYFIKNILEHCGYKVGLIGTNHNMIGEEVIETERTTPESLELNELFAKMVEEKVNYVVMEVSSHSLFLDRVAEIEFEIGALTNITQDHLDFHKTMEEYAKAKSILFRNSIVSVINKEDPFFDLLEKEAKGKVLTYGVDQEVDICAYDILMNQNGVSFNVKTEDEDYRIYLPIPGTFMVYNALLAISVATALRIPSGFIRLALKNQQRIKGRLEVLDIQKDYSIIIDYAHSPDGLYNLLTTVNEFKEARLITVFGCGGDRDRKKRSIMGDIATNLSDFTIITSDNPRTEDPSEIIKDILEGVKGKACEYKVIENRREAIGYAMSIAKNNDIIVLAGKGHETYQILKQGTIHFDEREIVKEFLIKGD